MGLCYAGFWETEMAVKSLMSDEKGVLCGVKVRC
jgi:hypothetical protein